MTWDPEPFQVAGHPYQVTPKRLDTAMDGWVAYYTTPHPWMPGLKATSSDGQAWLWRAYWPFDWVGFTDPSVSGLKAIQYGVKVRVNYLMEEACLEEQEFLLALGHLPPEKPDWAWIRVARNENLILSLHNLVRSKVLISQLQWVGSLVASLEVSHE